MSKPVIVHPNKKSKPFPKTTVIVQGFHPKPGLLEAHLTDGNGTNISGTPAACNANRFFAFSFQSGVKPGKYTLTVNEKGKPDQSSSVDVEVTGKEFFGSSIAYPSPNDPTTPIPQTFVAWGTPSTGAQAGSDDQQTTIGNSGAGAVTTGSSQSAPPGYFMIQFVVTDSPFQNPYALTINDTLPSQSQVQPLYLTNNPPSP